MQGKIQGWGGGPTTYSAEADPEGFHPILLLKPPLSNHTARDNLCIGEKKQYPLQKDGDGGEAWTPPGSAPGMDAGY